MKAESMSINDLKDLLPRPYSPAWDVLESTSNEEEFTKAAFLILQECGTICAAIAGIQVSSELGRNQAICTGLAIRLTKLAKIVIRDLANHDTFQQLSIARQIFETSATLVYLLHDDGAGERFNKYVQDSLISEKMVLKDVERNINNRGGETLEIETRMRASITKTAQAAGISDINGLPSRKEIDLPSVEERLKYLGENVYIAYRTGSSEVHGTWTDLYKNHILAVDADKFVPNPDDPRAQPNVGTTTVSVLARVFGVYLDWLDIDAIRELYDPLLEEIIKKNGRLVGLHEGYVVRQQGQS